MMKNSTNVAEPGITSVDKAFEICEALSGRAAGLGLSDLGRSLDMPPPTVHRLLSILKRRGYVRQDDETGRYRLTLKVLDLGFRLLGRSELKLYAYPVLREYTLRTKARCFIAAPAVGVTYVWGTGPDEVEMHTAYGKDMPGHCALYFDEAHARRRLSCLRLVKPGDVGASVDVVHRPAGTCEQWNSAQRLICTCAPVRDFTGLEVARVGLFEHAPDDGAILTEHNRGVWELARLISMRLGHLPHTSAGVTA